MCGLSMNAAKELGVQQLGLCLPTFLGVRGLLGTFLQLLHENFHCAEIVPMQDSKKGISKVHDKC